MQEEFKEFLYDSSRVRYIEIRISQHFARVAEMAVSELVMFPSTYHCGKDYRHNFIIKTDTVHVYAQSLTTVYLYLKSNHELMNL